MSAAWMVMDHISLSPVISFFILSPVSWLLLMILPIHLVQ